MRTFFVFMILVLFGGCASQKRAALEHTAFSSTTSAGIGAGVGAVVGNQLGLVGEGAGIGAGAGFLSGLVLGSQLDNLAYRQELAERKLAAIDDHLAQQRNLLELTVEKNFIESLEHTVKTVDVYFEPDKSEISPSFKSSLEAICLSFKQLNYPATVALEAKVREGKNYNQDMILAKTRLTNIRSFLESCGINKSLLEDKVITVLIEPADHFEINQVKVSARKGLAIKEQ